jgi:hypothetical protein
MTRWPFRALLGIVFAWFQVSTAQADSLPLCAVQSQAAAMFRGELWLGGFQGGVCVQRGGQWLPVASPSRFINDMLVVQDALYVASHEGLFVTRDGARFDRVDQVNMRGANGLASDGLHLWVSTPSVLFELSLVAGGKSKRMNRPGGTTAIQALAIHQKTLWLATEDRGLVRIQGDHVTVFDALRGLGSSWVVDVDVDAQGNAYAATLRDGLFRVSRTGEVSAIDTGHPWLLRVHAQEQALFVGAQDGLITRDAQGKLQEIYALPDRHVHMLYRTSAGLWVGTEHGTTLITGL